MDLSRDKEEKRGEDSDVPPGKKYKIGNAPSYEWSTTPPLMDRSGIVRSSFVRPSIDRGKMPTELVGRVYKTNLDDFLNMTVETGRVWRKRSAKWPENQIAEQRAAARQEIEFVPKPEELARIEYYLNQDIRQEDVEQLPEYLWQRVMNQTNTKYTTDKRLQPLLKWLRQRAEGDWDRGSREALLREALQDPWQQERLMVRALPPSFPRFVVTEPAPWALETRSSRQFCTKSLMAASSVVLSMHYIWETALGDKMELLPTNELAEFRPFYLNDLEDKVTNYLTSARHRILHYLFLCAEHMWVKQKQWEWLINKQTNVSEDLIRLMNCLSSLALQRLRNKTTVSKEAWKKLILGITEEGSKPLIKFRLDESTQVVRDDITRAQQFMSTTFVRIFEVTRELPSVATLMFNPDHKYRKPATS